MDFLILSLFLISLVLFIMGLSYLDICFRGLAQKLIFNNNMKFDNIEGYKKYQGRATLILSLILLSGIFILYIVRSMDISIPLLDYWTLLLVIFSIIYGRISRRYFNSQTLRKK